MTYYQRQGERPEIGVFYGFHHVRFFVSNAKQASAFYTSRFGMKPAAYEGLETGSKESCSYVVKCNDVCICFTSSLLSTDNEIAQHVSKHGDGVKDIAFSVEDCRKTYQRAITNGAKSVREPTELKDSNGTVVVASIQTYGDTIHSFIQNVDYTGPFLPGFKVLEKDDPVNAVFGEQGFETIDHIVGNQPEGDMTPTAEWYERMLEFHRYWSVDDSIIHTEYSSLRSIVVADWDENIKMPINEPASGSRKSQIQEFVDYYAGPGVQHIALRTPDIIQTVSQMKARGVEFLMVPKAYYDNLRERLSHSSVNIQEDLDKIEELGLLVDFDDSGYLLQIFTKPVEDRPTLFFEVIQRRNHNGFGVGNFKALFEAIEQEQEKRGNLV